MDYETLTKQLEELAAGPPATLLQDEPLRQRLLLAVQRVLPEIEKPKDAIQRVMYTPLELVGARIGCNLKVFEILHEASGPLTTDTLAQRTGAHPRTLARILRYLASIYMIKELDVDSWGPSTLTHTLAQPAVAAGVAHNRDTAFTSSHDGKGPFEWFNENPANLQSFSTFMTIQRYSSDVWLDKFPFVETVIKDRSNDSRPLFVDVGGGVGHQSKAVLDQFPELSGRIVLQDQQGVLDGALPVEGVILKSIDFFTESPVPGARSYYLRNILHDWPDDSCITILANVKSAMAPDSLLLIDEVVIPARNAHKIAMQVDLTMLGNFASEERTEGRWNELFTAAGFNIEKVYTYSEVLGDSAIVAKAA